MQKEKTQFGKKSPDCVFSYQRSNRDLVFFHPVIELDKICDQLWTCHQLAKPWFSVFRRSRKEFSDLSRVKKRKNRGIRVRENLFHSVDQKLLIARVIGLGIRTFPAVQKLRWKKVAAGIAKQCFFNTILVFHMPWHVKNIFNDAVIGEWNSCLKTGIHACAVHTVKQSLHKPFDIQIADDTPALILRRLIREKRYLFF